MFGLATSVAMVSDSKPHYLQPCPVGAQHAAPLLPRRKQSWPAVGLVRRLFVRRHFNAVLFLPVADGGLDGVFREHGTMNLDRRERKLAHHVRVLYGKRLFDRLSLLPLGIERGTGHLRPPAPGLVP